MMQVDFTKITKINNGLRPYQIKAKDDIYDAWLRYRNVMFQMPTGTGKTMLFSSIIKDLHEYSDQIQILILAHREELIEQISHSIGRKHGISHGKIKAGYNEEKYYNVQVASVQTIVRRLEDRWDKREFDFIIIDEAHHALAKTYVKIYDTFPKAKILGVTATPYRLNAEPFTPMFDILVKSKSVHSFIKEGWLSDYEYYSLKPDSTMQHLINSIAIDKTGDYSEASMKIELDKEIIRANLVESYLKFAAGKKGIIYTIDRDHNLHVMESFQKIGCNVAAIDCHTPTEERRKHVDRFKKGEIDIICNVNIFSEGFDCPDVEFIQLARPTLSLSLYLQQVGRGFRKATGKEKVIFIDNVGQYNKFGLPSVNRKWQWYFEGKHEGVNIEMPESIPKLLSIEYEEEKVPYSEGEEDIKLLYNSKFEEQEPQETEDTFNTKLLLISNNTNSNASSLNIKEIMNKLRKLNEMIEYARQEGLSIQDDWLLQKEILEESLIEECVIPDLQSLLANADSYGINKDFDVQIHFDRIKGFEIQYAGKTYIPTTREEEDNEEDQIGNQFRKRRPKTILKVSFPEGITICKSMASDTVVDVIEKIGAERVSQVKNLNFLSPSKVSTRCQRLSNGYYVITQSSTEAKRSFIEELSSALNLGLKVEIVSKK